MNEEKTLFDFDGYEFVFEDEKFIDAKATISDLIAKLRKKLSRKRISKKKLNELLLASIIIGDVFSLVKAINRGADVNWKDKFGWNPLMFAIKEQNIPAIFILVKAGADLKYTIQEEDFKGSNVLHIAYRNGSNQLIINYLIEKGADPKQMDAKGRLPEWYGTKEAAKEAAEEVYDAIETLVGGISGLGLLLGHEGDENE